MTLKTKQKSAVVGKAWVERYKRLCKMVDHLIDSAAAEERIHPEEFVAFAKEHLRKHPRWGTVPTKRQKLNASKYWKGVCYQCKKKTSYEHAVFSHRKLGIAGQNKPPNMIMEHQSCFNKRHGINWDVSNENRSPRKRS